MASCCGGGPTSPLCCGPRMSHSLPRAPTATPAARLRPGCAPTALRRRTVFRRQRDTQNSVLSTRPFVPTRMPPSPFDSSFPHAVLIATHHTKRYGGSLGVSEDRARLGWARAAEERNRLTERARRREAQCGSAGVSKGADGSYQCGPCAACHGCRPAAAFDCRSFLQELQKVARGGSSGFTRGITASGG